MLRKLAQQSAIYGISTILGRLLSYLLTPYYTRLFSPSEYGIITDLYALIPFALVILTMGMESSYFRFCAKVDEAGGTATEIARGRDRLYATTWGVTSLLAIIFTGIVIWFNTPLSHLMGAAYVAQPELVSLVAAIILFDVATAIPFARLRERGDAGKYVALKLLNIVLQVGFAIGFGLMGLFSSPLGVGWVLIANLVASVITLLLTICVARPYTLPRIEWATLRPIMLYSLPLLVSGVAATATEFIDRQLIKYIAPEGAMAQLGLYGAVTKVAVVMTLFTQMYRLAAEPFFLSNFKREQFEESTAAAMKYYIIASITIFLGIVLFDDLFALIVGREFREGLYILPVILGSNLLMGVWLNLSFWYKREEKTRFALYITLLGLASTIVINLLLIPRMGYAGAAWARFASESVMVLFSYMLMRRYFPIPYDLCRIGEYVLLGIIVYYANTLISREVGNIWAVWGVNIVMLLLFVSYATCREGIDLRGLIFNKRDEI